MMNAKIRCCFFILTLLITNCQNTPSDYNSIARSLNTEMENAFKKGELKKLAVFYADDAYILSPNRPTIHSRKAIDAYCERWHTPINWTLDVIDVSQNEQDIYEHNYWENKARKPKHWKEEGIEVGDDADVFYQLGHSKIEYESDDGMHRMSEVDFIFVWIKGPDGFYYIFVDTFV